MKLTIKPVLGTSILLAALVAAPLVYSGGQHTKGMEGMTGQHDGQMMNMGDMQNRMNNMSEMMNEAHNTKDMKKRHELMQKHMSEMQGMMGNMQGMMMGDKMPGNMSMEQRQEMMGKRMDMMQGMMEQMMKQQSMMMDMDK